MIERDGKRVKFDSTVNITGEEYINLVTIAEAAKKYFDKQGCEPCEKHWKEVILFQLEKFLSGEGIVQSHD